MTMCRLPIFAALLGSALGAIPVPCSNPVTVTVMVKDTWCKASHPHDYQPDIGGDGPISWPHISWPVVHTHDGTHPSWDEYATQGVANIATTGNTNGYIDEVRPLAHTLWRGGVMTSCGGSNPTPPATSVGLKLNEQNSWVSAIYMMAPSPDWISGIKAVNMCVDGYWSRSKTVTGVVYDAGVDAGMYFNTANVPEALNTNMITEILCDGESGPFCNQANTGVNHVVEFEIVTAHYLCINNYWPLLEKEVDANGASPSGTSHMHAFDSITYYMPNGFAGAKHGEPGFSCPCTVDPTAMCPEISSPVCGADGITYSNDCEAKAACQLEGSTSGKCPCTVDPTAMCPEIYKPVCGANGITYSNDCKAKAACQFDGSTLGTCPCTVDPNPECSKEKVPVCGANGITYGNQCLAKAACQFDSTPGTCCKDKKKKCKVKKCHKRTMFGKKCQATCAAHCLEDPENKKCPKDKKNNKKCNPPKGKSVDCTSKKTRKMCPLSCPVCVLPAFDCYTKDVWSDEKIKWCCDKMQIGCLA